MSKEYVQALDDLFGLVVFQKSLTKEQYARVQEYNDIIEQALHRLEAIDNADPSEAMECLQQLAEMADKCWVSCDVHKWKTTIKQALLKSQEQEKVLKIIIDKEVNLGMLKICKTVEQYNAGCKIFGRNELTEEEFELLKRYFE